MSVHIFIHTYMLFGLYTEATLIHSSCNPEIYVTHRIFFIGVFFQVSPKFWVVPESYFCVAFFTCFLFIFQHFQARNYTYTHTYIHTYKHTYLHTRKVRSLGTYGTGVLKVSWAANHQLVKLLSNGANIFRAQNLSNFFAGHWPLLHNASDRLSGIASGPVTEDHRFKVGSFGAF
jgi:hypothetical protein